MSFCSDRIECVFGEKCYQTDFSHFLAHKHSHLEKLIKPNLEVDKENITDNYLNKRLVFVQIRHLIKIKKAFEVLQNKSALTNFADKLENNAPYNIFFTAVPMCPATKLQKNSIVFTDLLCSSLGELECSLQITYMLDIFWLMEQYQLTGNEQKPLTIIYGEEDLISKEHIAQHLPNVTEHYIEKGTPFGLHHSKLGIYAYTDGSLRVVVSTANMYRIDWEQFGNGLWVSPLCRPIPDVKNENYGNGPTDFKNSLIKYLSAYKLKCLESWIAKVKRTDFSEINVCLVASLPGTYKSGGLVLGFGCHLQRVGNLLSRHCSLPESEDTDSWSIICQSSSVGFFGENPDDWFKNALIKSLASHTKCSFPSNPNTDVCIVFPTENSLKTFAILNGHCSLMYSDELHKKQKWIEKYLYKWKAENTRRTDIMPHIKTYCRISPCRTRLAYFLLTSANISRSAWGTTKDVETRKYFVRSHELGVLFLPKFFNEQYFQVKEEGETGKKLFPIIYDLPLTPYSPDDTPLTY